MENKRIDNTAIDDWIHQTTDGRPGSQAACFAAVCSFLGWAARELIFNNESHWGAKVQILADDFGKRLTQLKKPIKHTATVNKNIREQVDPDLLPRLRTEMLKWLNSEDIKQIRTNLKDWETSKTLPSSQEANYLSNQLATVLAVSNGARPQVSSLMEVQDLNTLTENKEIMTGLFFTIELQKFNPGKKGTFNLD